MVKRQPLCMCMCGYVIVGVYMFVSFHLRLVWLLIGAFGQECSKGLGKRMKLLISDVA